MDTNNLKEVAFEVVDENGHVEILKLEAGETLTPEKLKHAWLVYSFITQSYKTTIHARDAKSTNNDNVDTFYYDHDKCEYVKGEKPKYKSLWQRITGV